MTRTAALLALVIAITPLAARAEAEETTVTLNNGAFYRGVVVERVPDDHVTLKLATGDVKRFEWKDVKSDTFGTSPSAAPVGPIVHLDARPGAFLERPLGATSHYERVCDAPCDRRLAPGIYRAKAPGYSASKPFSVEGSQSKTVTANLSSAGRTWGGVLLIVLGTAAIGTGVFDLTTNSKDDRMLGYGLTAIGGATILGGIIAIATNRSSLTVDGHQLALDRAGKWRVGADGLKF